MTKEKKTYQNHQIPELLYSTHFFMSLNKEANVIS